MAERLDDPQRADKEREQLADYVSALRAQQERSPGLSVSPFSAKALGMIEEALNVQSAGTRTFDQVRDAIVKRMSGHTFSLRDAPAIETFLALLAQVKESECALSSAQSASERTGKPE